MILAIVPLSVFADETETAIPHKDLSETTIEYDFNTVFYKRFNVSDYVKNSKKDFEFIAATETFVDGFSNFFVYVYNPQQKNINIKSDKNTLNIAYYSKAKDNLDIDDIAENDFNKLPLTFICSYGAVVENESFSNGTILKFKVGGNLLNVESEKERLNRHYKLADLELLIDNNNNPVHFVVGRHFEIMCKNGYTFTYENDLAILDVDAYHTFYRTETEDVDVYKDIQSIYFPVPKEYENLYGSLYSMKINYTVEKYNPILLCQNYYVANAFMTQYIDNDTVPKFDNSNFKWSVVYDKVTWNAGDLLCDAWNKVYNLSPLSTYKDLLYGHKSSVVKKTFYNFDGIVEMPLYPDVAIPVENAEEFPLRLAIQYTGDYSPSGLALNGYELLPEIDKYQDDEYFKYSSVYYSKEITVDDIPGSFNKYKICSGWQNFWNFGYKNVAGEEIPFEPFQKIDINDLTKLDKQTFSGKYLVDINDIKCTNDCGNCISCAVKNEKYSDCDWYLLRYEQTDFKSYDAVLIDNTTGYYYKDDNKAFVIQTDVIRNFDTISLKFKQETEDGAYYNTFPIGRTPTDFIADVTFPSEKPNIDLDSIYKNLGNKTNDLIEKIMAILKIAIIFVSAILILRVVSLLVPAFKSFRKINRKEKNNEKKNN